ncbi:hypothetical protein [Salinisphaera hydrothermalis]|uniref:Uncharacterized protein n=1 Tax=Salinisphaera hydrothermalis (strain C41B8) TaxID=1304275 RepID=A0A084INN5_SALHC|nr:hypothetical protein [Salinisphaera hydrothermalis]KEZ78319.1 hypothetical protein C41B8_05438 [Salinisphaera hydrothermalis C41B8]
MITEFRDRLRRRLKEKRDALAAGMLQGGANDYADYRERVGRAKGLADAHETIDEVIKELQYDEDD